jgi:acetyl-CoA acetyltransferase
MASHSMRAQYDASRWIVEPLHLYDCCQENDGAAAVVWSRLNGRGRCATRPHSCSAPPQGQGHRTGAHPHNAPHYASASFDGVARTASEWPDVTPADVGVVQVYENFTGGVVMALAEHGFFAPEQANEFLTLENLTAPAGKLPFNTSGGNLAEAYLHGFELVVEATRQIRRTSTSQAARSDTRW